MPRFPLMRLSAAIAFGAILCAPTADAIELKYDKSTHTATVTKVVCADYIYNTNYDFYCPGGQVYQGENYAINRLAYQSLKNLPDINNVYLSSIHYIDDGAFFSVSDMKRIYFSNDLKELGEYVFNSCYGLRELMLPPRVVKCGTLMKQTSQDFVKAAYPSTVENPFPITDNVHNNIHGWAVEYDPEGAAIEGNFIYSRDKTILSYLSVFQEGEVDIPQTVTGINDKALSLCTDVTAIFFPKQLEYIGAYAADGCSKIHVAPLPSTVTYIGEGAFRNCTNLALVNLPNNLETLGDNAFEGCTAISEINYLSPTPISASDNVFTQETYDNAQLTVLAPALYLSPWNKFKNVTVLEFTAESPEGVTFRYNMTDTEALTCEVAEVVSDKTLLEYTIPAYADYNGTTYTVTGVGAMAFKGMALHTIHFPETLKRIKESAFNRCDLLSPLTFPDGLEQIDKDAFSLNKRLNEIVIPANIKIIDEYAFWDCDFLRKVTYETDNPVICPETVFMNNTYSYGTLLVKPGTKARFKDILPWSKFKTIEEASHTDGLIDEIFTEGSGNDSPTEIYSLQGVKMNGNAETLQPGVYILRKGQETKKFFVK